MSDERGADAAIFCPTDHRLDIAANRQSDNQPFAFADHRLRPRHQAKARNIDDVNIARSGMTGKGRPEIDQIPSRSTQMGRTGWLAKRSEEHTSELQSLMRTSYAVFCLKKKTQIHICVSTK